MAPEIIQFLLLPLFLLFPIFWFIMKKTKMSSKNPTLPPGPTPWPVIGNVTQLGSNPHVSLSKMAQIYGPLISLKLGSHLFVVGSSRQAAMEILKTHDRTLSGREVPHVSYAKDPNMNHVSIIWTFDCSDQWKFLRALCKTELFSAKMIENHSCLRDKNSEDLVQFLRLREGVGVKIVDLVAASSFNFLATVFFSDEKFTSLAEAEHGGGMSGLIREVVEMCATPNVSDLFPILGGLDIQRLNKKGDKFVKKVCGSWARILAERKEGDLGDVQSRKKDFLDVLLENGFTDDQINYLFLELFAAGSHTTTSIFEWAMAEILKNSKILEKIHAELDKEIPESIVKESDLPRLTFLHATVKETLRLHPAAPLLIPHRATKECQVMNFTIPKDTQVLVNVWAVGRDPEIWENPLIFNPERFLDCGLDYKGNDFEFLPFGAGRRICPGMPMGIRQVELALANLFHCFEWSLPDGMVPEKLDMNEKFGVTLEKEQPLVIIPKYKW